MELEKTLGEVYRLKLNWNNQNLCFCSLFQALVVKSIQSKKLSQQQNGICVQSSGFVCEQQ